MVFLYVVIGYLLIVWVGLRLVVPHLGYGADPLPETVPPELDALIEKFNNESKTDTEYLEKCYAYVASTYQGSRVKTLTRFWKSFTNPFTEEPGYLPCTLQNYLLRTMLLKSGRFGSIEIQTHVVPFNFFLHQYLQVRADGKILDVDPWSAFLGVPLGKRSVWFG